MSAEVTTWTSTPAAAPARSTARSVRSTPCSRRPSPSCPRRCAGPPRTPATAARPTPLRDLPGHDPGPLGVDLVGELADRARNHGKRLRPVLAHWGWAVAGGRGDSQPQLVRVAAALELLHLFALIQDDVMDRSASRRGLPTLHVVAAERHREQAGLGDAAAVRRQRRHPGRPTWR